MLSELSGELSLGHDSESPSPFPEKEELCFTGRMRVMGRGGGWRLVDGKNTYRKNKEICPQFPGGDTVTLYGYMKK